METPKISVWKCIVTGLLAGFINGFFGAGGGMLVVPLLVYLVKLPDKAAFSTAISIILPLSIVSLVIYARQGAVDFSASVPYLLGGAAGGVLAGLLFHKTTPRFLHLALGGLIFLGGVRLIVC